MLVTAMYKEVTSIADNDNSYIQDVIIIKGHKRWATMERCSTIRNHDDTIRYATGEKVIRRVKNYLTAVELCFKDGCKPMELVETMYSFDDETVNIYQLDSGECIFVRDNVVSKKFKSATIAENYLYKRGYIY